MNSLDNIDLNEIIPQIAWKYDLRSYFFTQFMKFL